jgi:hypothetical protein
VVFRRMRSGAVHLRTKARPISTAYSDGQWHLELVDRSNRLLDGKSAFILLRPAELCSCITSSQDYGSTQFRAESVSVYMCNRPMVAYGSITPRALILHLQSDMHGGSSYQCLLFPVLCAATRLTPPNRLRSPRAIDMSDYYIRQACG